MELSNEQKDKLKDILLEILRCFINICEKENLQYYLLYGTALGSIRHKGFIPWDDDIDVGMPREEYEKFLTIAPKYLPEYYFLQNFYSDAECPNNFSKIRDTRTTFIETSCQNIKMHHGVFIDIFPLDGYSTSVLMQKFLAFKNKLLSKRIYQIFVINTDKSTLKHKLISKISNFLYPDYKTAIRKRESIYKKYDYEKSDYVVSYSGAWGKKEIMPKSFFGSGCISEFEGIKVLVPEKYDQYLGQLYGDYMTLPPEGKRVGHHFCTIIDLENPYSKYINDDVL